MTIITMRNYSSPVYLAYVMHKARKAAESRKPQPSKAQKAQREKMVYVTRYASEMYRAFCEKHPEARNAVTWRLALRESWAIENAARDRERFFSQPGEAQLEALRKLAALCPKWAARQARIPLQPITDPEKLAQMGSALSWARWMSPQNIGGAALVPWGEALDMIASDAWVSLRDGQEMDDDGNTIFPHLPTGKPWYTIISNAIVNACQRLDRFYRPQRGSQASLEEIDTEFNISARYPSPEESTIQFMEITAFANDEIDTIICQAKAYGLKEHEITKVIQKRTGKSLKLAAIARRWGRIKERRAIEEYAPENYSQPQPEKPQKPKEWYPDNASSAPGTGRS